MDFVSNTPREREEMLNTVGVEEVEELFSVISDEIALKNPLDIDGDISEYELFADIKNLADKNTSLQDYVSFLGAGAYDHYIPAAIDHLITRSEFYTAYTPYQAELSQGTLQAIYEYQSMICELTGMGIANASLLDGGSATGEAVTMASRISRNNKVLISKGVHPNYRQVAKTYAGPQDIEFEELNLKGSITDIRQLEDKLDKDIAAVVVQYPNFYGSIEDLKQIQQLVDNYKKVQLVIIANPISLGILTPPAEFGADIVVGEGQPLGNTINYGGPYLGFMAIKDNRRYLRQMPGRIAGATTDVEGKRGYVLTLQTREQHIRRERATSNICSNEALNALIATIYMSLMGKKGIREVAYQSTQKAHYLAEKIDNIPNFEVVNRNNFYHEFWVKSSYPYQEIEKKLMDRNILPGLNLDRFKEEEGILVSVTEKRRRSELDAYISGLEVIADE